MSTKEQNLVLDVLGGVIIQRRDLAVEAFPLG